MNSSPENNDTIIDFYPNPFSDAFPIENINDLNESHFSYNFGNDYCTHLEPFKFDEYEERNKMEKITEKSENLKEGNFNLFLDTKSISIIPLESSGNLSSNGKREIKEILFKIEKVKKTKTKYDTAHLILRTLKRNFINTFIMNKVKELLKKEFPKKKFKNFKKFPKVFVDHVNKDDYNKNMVDMLLIELFVNPKLFIEEKNKKPKNYEHNLDIINNLNKNSKVIKYLNKKTLRGAYGDYLKSNDVQILFDKAKEEHPDNIKYHEKLLFHSDHFLEHFSKNVKERAF